MPRTRHPMREAAQEEALISRARSGDREAFDQLVRAHFERVYAFLFRMIQNHEDAEDLAQDCFVRAWGALALYRGECAFSTWLARIALHLARDRQRAVSRRFAIPGLGEDEGSEPADPRAAQPNEEVERDELGRAVAHALDRLPARLREAIVLRSLEGRDYDEVAKVTGLRPATARTHVMQARRMLMRWLAPWIATREENRNEQRNEIRGETHREEDSP